MRVAVAESSLTAEMIRESLEQAGIPAMLRNLDAASVTLGGSAAAPWSVEVFVLEHDAPLASALLGGTPVPEALPPPAVGSGVPARRHWWRRLTGRL